MRLLWLAEGVEFRDWRFSRDARFISPCWLRSIALYLRFRVIASGQYSRRAGNKFVSAAAPARAALRVFGELLLLMRIYASGRGVRDTFARMR